MARRVGWLAFAALVLGLAGPAVADDEVRIATYNIKYLSTDVDVDDPEDVADHAERLEKLRDVLADLDADVIGLQEIDDRAALERIFDPTDWHLVIDDDSGENQDLALAVRGDFTLVGGPDDGDADDAHFFFPDDTDDDAFPDRRDALAVTVRTPDTGSEFLVVVLHAKSRWGGRAATDHRREAAARLLVARLETVLDGADVVVLGDFNDNPDDRSVNILETGDPGALGGMENEPGPFLINLVEPLLLEDIVSHGLKSNDVDEDGRVDPVAVGSRLANDLQRGTNQNSGDILFDQILVSPGLHDHYVPGSADVFRGAAAVEGDDGNRASDHVPVAADFVFASGGGGPQPQGVVIVGLLPDPDGDDARNEQVRLRNGGAGDVPLDGWTLVDRAENTFALSGTIGAGDERTLTLDPHTMPLNNGGDEIRLVDADGSVVDRVKYARSVVERGLWIEIP